MNSARRSRGVGSIGCAAFDLVGSRRLWKVLLWEALLLLFLLGCSGTVASPESSAPDASAPDADTGTVTVGVTSDLRAGIDLKSLHVVMRADGVVLRDEVLELGAGAQDFPIELGFVDQPGGALVEVEIDAFGTDSPGTPILTRAASTKVIAGKNLLLRVTLYAECVLHIGDVPCDDGLTCDDGVCRDPFTSPDILETYTNDWSEHPPDICKPVGAGAPVVIIGQGQADYAPLEDYGVAQVEQGSAGGFHIWLAFRTRNLRHAGSIIEVTGTVPELGEDLPLAAYTFSFTPDASGYCELSGVRIRLVDDPLDIDDLLGKVIKVNVTITDRDGSIGTAKKYITLSSDYTPNQ